MKFLTCPLCDQDAYSKGDMRPNEWDNLCNHLLKDHQRPYSKCWCGAVYFLWGTVGRTPGLISHIKAIGSRITNITYSRPRSLTCSTKGFAMCWYCKPILLSRYRGMETQGYMCGQCGSAWVVFRGQKFYTKGTYARTHTEETAANLHRPGRHSHHGNGSSSPGSSSPGI